MIEALRRQITTIDRRNISLKNQWTENEIEMVRIDEAIKELEKSDKQYKALGLKAVMTPLDESRSIPLL